MVDIFLAFIIGALLGAAVRPRDRDIAEQKKLYDDRVKAFEYDIAYYKRLTKNLVEENNNLKQWERRYLDVIESLSYDSKQALNPDLRTHDGRLE